MLLTGVKKEKDWLRSQWRLTYPTGWNNICRGCVAVIMVELDLSYK